jgi:hypothetical protein
MRRLFYSQITGVPPVDEIIEDVQRTSAEEIIIICVREWECNQINIEFSNKLKEFNVKVRPIYGSFKTEYYDKRHASANLPVEDAYFWGTFWINYMELSTRNLPSRYKFQKEFKYKYISLNNRSHYHRCMFIDTLAKYNLIDKGVVTWIKHLNENSDFPYKYYDNSQRLLDDNFVNTLDSMSLPKEYDESFFDVITEATADKMFMTEKTFFPIVLRKPFIVLGAKGFHKKLVELGFKLYDEIIDYSFDSLDSLEERTEGVVQNVQRIINCDTMEVYNSLKPKLLHNYIRMLELSGDSSLIPEGIQTYCDEDVTKDPHRIMFKNFLNKKQKQDKIMSIWGERGIQYLPDDIKYIKTNHEDINQVIVHVAQEAVYDFYQEVIDVCSQYKIPTVLLTSTYKYNQNLLEWTNEKYNNTLVIDWPAYWLARGTLTMCEYKWYITNSNNGLDINKQDVGLGYSINYLYITMNNLARRHRCILMDMLAKHNLIDNGAISWRDVLRTYDSTRTEIVCENNYDWKYWTPKKMILDFPMDLTSNVEQSCLPPQYKNSFMQIVSESDDINFFLTEKTTTALIFNKLFLVAGSKNFHANLKDMGFELYDELFDYSFDNEDDIELRYEGIVKNVSYYRNKTFAELEQIIELMKDKLMRNRVHALKLAREIPDAFYNMVERIKQNSDPTVGYINRVKELEIFKEPAHVRH